MDRGQARERSRRREGQERTSNTRILPADLSNPSNGPTVASATMHGIYVNGTQDVWGYPASFLNDLNQSTMIKITDAYVGTSVAGRYPIGNGLLLQGALPKIIYDDTILVAVYIGAA